MKREKHLLLPFCYLKLARFYLALLITKTYFFMRTLLYVIAIILVIGWVLGLTVYSAGSIIHVLLVLAIISLLLGLIRRGEV
jgi:hypothetical protein